MDRQARDAAEEARGRSDAVKNRGAVAAKQKNNVAMARWLRIDPRTLLWDDVSSVNALTRGPIARRGAHVLLHSFLILAIAVVCAVFLGFTNPRTADVGANTTTVHVHKCHVMLACESHGPFHWAEQSISQSDTNIVIDGSGTERCTATLCVQNYTTRASALSFILSKATVDLTAWTEAVPFSVSVTSKVYSGTLQQEAAKVTLGAGRFHDLFINVSRGVVTADYFAATTATIIVYHGPVMLDFDFQNAPFTITGSTRDEAYCVSPKLTAQAFISGPCSNATATNLATDLNVTSRVCPFHAASTTGSNPSMALSITASSVYFNAVTDNNETRIAGEGMSEDPRLDVTVLSQLADTDRWHAEQLQTLYVQVVDVITPTLGVAFSIASRKVLMEIGPNRLAFYSAFVMQPHHRRMRAVLTHYGCPAGAPRSLMDNLRPHTLTAYLSREADTEAMLREKINRFFPPESQFLVAMQIYDVVGDGNALVGVDSQAHKRKTLYEKIFGSARVVLKRDEDGIVTESGLKQSGSTIALIAINYIAAVVMLIGVNLVILIYRREIIEFVFLIDMRKKLRDQIPREIPLCAYHYYFSFNMLITWFAFRVVCRLVFFGSSPSSFIATYFRRSEEQTEGIVTPLVFKRVQQMFRSWSLQRYDTPTATEFDLTAAIESNGGQRLMLQKPIVRGLKLRDPVPSGAVAKNLRLRPEVFTRRDLKRFFTIEDNDKEFVLLDDVVLFARDLGSYDANATRLDEQLLQNATTDADDSKENGKKDKDGGLATKSGDVETARKTEHKSSGKTEHKSKSKSSGTMYHDQCDLERAGKLRDAVRARLLALHFSIDSHMIDMVTGIELVYDDFRKANKKQTFGLMSIISAVENALYQRFSDTDAFTHANSGETTPAKPGKTESTQDRAKRLEADVETINELDNAYAHNHDPHDLELADDTNVLHIVVWLFSILLVIPSFFLPTITATWPSKMAWVNATTWQEKHAHKRNEMDPHRLSTRGTRRNAERMERWAASWPKETALPSGSLFAFLTGSPPLTRKVPRLGDINRAWDRKMRGTALRYSVVWIFFIIPRWIVGVIRALLSFFDLSVSSVLASVLSFAPFIAIISLNVLGDFQRVRYATITDRNTMEELYASMSFIPGFSTYQGGDQSFRTEVSVWMLYLFIVMYFIEPLLVVLTFKSFGAYAKSAPWAEWLLCYFRIAWSMALCCLYWMACCGLICYLCLAMSWWVLGAIIAPDYMLVVATAVITFFVATARTLSSYMDLRTESVEEMQQKIMELFLAIIRRTPAESAITFAQNAKGQAEEVAGCSLMITAGTLMDAASTDPNAALAGVAELAVAHGVPDAVILLLLAAASRTPEAIERGVKAAFKQLSVDEELSVFGTQMACIAAGAPTSTQQLASSLIDLLPEDGGLQAFTRDNQEVLAGAIRALALQNGPVPDRNVMLAFVTKTAAAIASRQMNGLIRESALIDLVEVARRGINNGAFEDQILLCRSFAEMLAIVESELCTESSDVATIISVARHTALACAGEKNNLPAIVYDVLGLTDFAEASHESKLDIKKFLDTLTYLVQLVDAIDLYDLPTEAIVSTVNAILSHDGLFNSIDLRLCLERHSKSGPVTDENVVVLNSRVPTERTNEERKDPTTQQPATKEDPPTGTQTPEQHHPTRFLSWYATSPTDMDTNAEHNKTLHNVLREARSFHRRLSNRRIEHAAAEVDTVLIEALQAYGRDILREASGHKPAPELPAPSKQKMKLEKKTTDNKKETVPPTSGTAGNAEDQPGHAVAMKGEIEESAKVGGKREGNTQQAPKAGTKEEGAEKKAEEKEADRKAAEKKAKKEDEERAKSIIYSDFIAALSSQKDTGKFCRTCCSCCCRCCRRSCTLAPLKVFSRNVDRTAVMNSITSLYLAGSCSMIDSTALTDCLGIEEDVLEILVNPASLADQYSELKVILPPLLHCASRRHMDPRNTAAIAQRFADDSEKCLRRALIAAGDTTPDKSVRVFLWLTGASDNATQADICEALGLSPTRHEDGVDEEEAVKEKAKREFKERLTIERNELLSFGRRVIERRGILKAHAVAASRHNQEDDTTASKTEEESEAMPKQEAEAAGEAKVAFDCTVASRCRQVFAPFHELLLDPPKNTDRDLLESFDLSQRCRHRITKTARVGTDAEIAASLYSPRLFVAGIDTVMDGGMTRLADILSCRNADEMRLDRQYDGAVHALEKSKCSHKQYPDDVHEQEEKKSIDLCIERARVIDQLKRELMFEKLWRDGQDLLKDRRKNNSAISDVRDELEFLEKCIVARACRDVMELHPQTILVSIGSEENKGVAGNNGEAENEGDAKTAMTMNADAENAATEEPAAKLISDLASTIKQNCDTFDKFEWVLAHCLVPELAELFGSQIFKRSKNTVSPTTSQNSNANNASDPKDNPRSPKHNSQNEGKGEKKEEEEEKKKEEGEETERQIEMIAHVDQLLFDPFEPTHAVCMWAVRAACLQIVRELVANPQTETTDKNPKEHAEAWSEDDTKNLFEKKWGVVFDIARGTGSTAICTESDHPRAFQVLDTLLGTLRKAPPDSSTHDSVVPPAWSWRNALSLSVDKFKKQVKAADATNTDGEEGERTLHAIQRSVMDFVCDAKRREAFALARSRLTVNILEPYTTANEKATATVSHAPKSVFSCGRRTRAQRLLAAWASVTVLGPHAPQSAASQLLSIVLGPGQLASIATALLRLRRNDTERLAPADVDALHRAVNDVRLWRTAGFSVSRESIKHALEVLYPDDFTPLHVLQSLAQGPVERIDGLPITAVETRPVRTSTREVGRRLAGKRSPMLRLINTLPQVVCTCILRR